MNYLVRDPAVGDSHYREGEDRSDAYARAGMIEVCTRCGRDLGENLDGQQAVVEYPSANAGSDDVYLTAVCWDCVPDVIAAVRQADALRASDDEPGRDTKGETPPEMLPAERCGPSCGCDGLELGQACLADESCSNCKAPRGVNENPLNGEDRFVDHGGQYAGY